MGQMIDSSPYSVYGIGLINSSGSALNKSLSGTGIGVSSQQFLNLTNPAAYTAPVYGTQITEFGIYGQKHLLSMENKNSSSGSANFSSLNFWFRFSKKFAGAVGIAPFSQVGYNITSQRNLNNDNVRVNYSGDGGMAKYYFGSGVNLSNNLRVGANLFLLHGSISAVELIESGELTGLEISAKTYLTGTGADMGIQYILNPEANNKVVVGTTFRPKTLLSTEKKLSVVNSSNLDSLYSELFTSTDYMVASKAGFGISIDNAKHLFALDISHLDYPETYTNNNVRLRDSYRLSGGYEFKGSQKPDSYWNFVRPRVSFYAEQNEALILNQKFLNWGTTLGLGLPVSNGRGFVNLTYNYNHLGTTSRNLLVQQTHSFSLDFSLMDMWGIRRKFD